MGILYRVYWRNPTTRVFEQIPNARVYAYQGEPKRLRPHHSAEWYTIEPADVDE